MDVDYNVDNEIGINVDVDGLHFGTLLPGGASVRTIKFDAFKDTRVIFIFENIDYVYPSENDFFMNEGDSKNIDFKAAIPLSLDHGKYKGTLKIIFKRAWNEIKKEVGS